MKTRDLIKLLEKNGFVFWKHGANHDLYRRGKDREAIVRHTETNEGLARDIIKKWGLK
ncbi:MAG: type II toxin-antitoxin system HicA family toxin [Clostridiales bacterium]|nr:type II toxin-antitoxin system HicA family toxin [Clostridiales bacterium]